MTYKSSLKNMFIFFLVSISASVYADFLGDLGHAVAAPVRGAAHVVEDAVEVTADTAETAVVGTEKVVTAPFRNHADHGSYETVSEETVYEDIT